MKLLLLTSLLFFAISANAQTATVVAEGRSLTNKEISEENIKLKISKKEKERGEIDKKYNLSIPVYDWQGYATFDSKEKLNEHIAKYDKIANDIFHNSNILSVCNEIDNLKSQISGSKSNACGSYNKNLRLARKNAANAKARIKQLNDVVEKEKYKANTHQSEMDFLDKELQGITSNSNQLSSQLGNVNKNNSSQSLDDFLASSNNTSNDFLSEKNNNNSDFLSETNYSTDYKITSKDGLNGVVNSKGEVLIPFKDWKILEYKMEIAKVSLRITEKAFPVEKSSDKYYCYINKVGFVDKTGQYINESTLTSEFSFSGMPAGLWLSPTNDDRSVEQIKRDRDRIRKLSETRKQQAKNEAQEWALNYIKQR